MKNKKVKIKMFGQEDTVSAEFYERADKGLIEIIIKENLIHKVKQQKYKQISEPVISEYEYLKQNVERFVRVPDKAEADLIVFRTTVKVIKEQP